MAGVLGARALIDVAFPTGIDAATIANYSLQQGISADQALALAAQVIGQANEEVARNYSGLWRVTEQLFARYRNGGGRSETPDAVEFSKTDPVRSDTVGHMLPFRDHEDYIAWTTKFEKRGDPELVMADLQLIKERWVNKVSRLFWTRALTDNENAIGSAGYDVGWAIGSGGSANFIPTQYEGITFDNTHTHYLYFDDATLSWADAFESGMEHLRHHGHVDGQIIIYISMTDIGEVAALSPGFVALTAPQLVYPGGNTGSPVSFVRGLQTGVPGQLVGYYNSVRWGLAEIRYSPRIPTNYAFATISYGENSMKNPFALRVEDPGFGLIVMADMTTTRPAKVNGLAFEGSFDIGVSDRTAGVALYLNAGASSWIDAVVA